MSDLVICVDFDGTIVDHRYPEIGPEAPGCFKWLRAWQGEGAKIVLFTMRSEQYLHQAADFIADNGIFLHGVNRNPDQDRWTTSPKAYGQIYVDDAAFGCPLRNVEGFNRPCVDWSIVGPAIMERISS